MSDVPKIVPERLRAAQPRDAHPDANALAAFAEQALSGAERDGVMRHLARCGDCREIVALSLPPLSEAEPVARPELARIDRPRTHSRFAWPSLRWAALAASVVVVASVLMLRPSHVAAPTDEAISLPRTSAPPSPLPERKEAAAVASQKSSEVREIPLAEKDSPRLNGLQFPGDSHQSVKVLIPGKRDDLRAKGSTLDNDIPSPVQDQRVTDSGRNLAAPPPPPLGGSSEVVTVQSGSAVMEPQTSRLPETLSNEAASPAVAKAKPALKEEADKKTPESASMAFGRLTSQAVSPLTRADALQKSALAAQWSLSQGKLRRSLDAGAHWQAALQTPQPLLAFGAFAGSVWAGGKSGTLMLSSDAGATWTAVHPATSDATLTADIVAIEMRTETDVTVSTAHHETWITADGGKTWTRK